MAKLGPKYKSLEWSAKSFKNKNFDMYEVLQLIKFTLDPDKRPMGGIF